jgi:hypothetical protein
MMAESRGYVIATVLFSLCLAGADAEEAIDRAGRKHEGHLCQEKDAWFFQADLGKRILLSEISYLRFDGKSTPVPAAPLMQTLLLPNGQRVSGILQSIEDKKITFVTSWGRAVSAPCAESLGIEQHALPIVYDDFESSLKPWRVAGEPSRSQERAFLGKSSLRFDRAGQSAARDWPAFRNGAVRLYFYDPALASAPRWTCEIIFATARQDNPFFVIDRGEYGCGNMKQPFGFLKATAGWHLLSIELEDGRLRIFIDDRCLGQNSLSAKDAIKGIRIASAEGKESGQLWIDEVLVTRRLVPLSTPMAVKDQDIVWLEHGEQIFGRVVSGNANEVLLDAKFGKHSFPWSRVRGIVFAKEKEMPTSLEPEITFRPGPGFPVDRLRAKLVRWDHTKLIVQQELLGEIAIVAERLDKIRFPAK